jgi:hypothetical protein
MVKALHLPFLIRNARRPRRNQDNKLATLRKSEQPGGAGSSDEIVETGEIA